MGSPVNIFMMGFAALTLIAFVQSLKTQDKHIYKDQPAPFNAWFGVFVLSLLLTLICVVIKFYAY